MITGTPLLITVCVLYSVALIICWYRDHKKAIARRIEREERRERQNREWREQFNVLPPNVRAAIRMVRRDRRDRAAVIALLRHFHEQRYPERKEKVDWKQEGF